MQSEMAQLHISPLSLRTLNTRLQQIATEPETEATVETPPVVQLDAIWVTQLVPTGTYHHDSKGRLRPDKKRIKRPIFIAMGVWPDTGRAEVLAWRLATQENEEDWLAFLTALEDLGIRGENGLELIIHDGGSGLCAALNTVHFGAEEQRCLFHKLRNSLQCHSWHRRKSHPQGAAPPAHRHFPRLSPDLAGQTAYHCHSNVTARLSGSIAPHNPRQSVASALTFALLSPILPSTSAILTGR
jgi:hypothetical protein